MACLGSSFQTANFYTDSVFLNTRKLRPILACFSTHKCSNRTKGLDSTDKSQLHLVLRTLPGESSQGKIRLSHQEITVRRKKSFALQLRRTENFAFRLRRKRKLSRFDYEEIKTFAFCLRRNQNFRVSTGTLIRTESPPAARRPSTFHP